MGYVIFQYPSRDDEVNDRKITEYETNCLIKRDKKRY